MTPLQSLVARTALGSAAAAGTFLLPACKRLFAGPAEDFDRKLTAVFIASRIVLFLFVFAILRLAPRGDIWPYFGEAYQQLHGGLPYNTIDTVYAPLHTFVDAACIWLWRTPLSLIIFAIVMECIALPLWMGVARGLWPADADDRAIRIAGLFYLACPLSLQFVAVDGQDNVVIGLFFALALLAALRHRELVSGLMVGLSISIVKFLPLPFAAIFFLSLKRRWRFALGGLLGTVPIYGAFALLHLNILLPFQEQGVLKAAGGVPYWVEVAGRLDLSSRSWNHMLLVLVIGVILWAGWSAMRLAAGPGPDDEHRERLRIIFFGLGAMILTIVCFASKTWPTYTMMALFPICFAAALATLRHGWKARALFALFGLTCVVEHSFYETFLHEASSLSMRMQLDAGSRVAWSFFGIEILLLGGYLWLLGLCLRAMNRTFKPL